jgi:hypothetical protein
LEGDLAVPTGVVSGETDTGAPAGISGTSVFTVGFFWALALFVALFFFFAIWCAINKFLFL